MFSRLCAGYSVGVGRVIEECGRRGNNGKMSHSKVADEDERLWLSSQIGTHMRLREDIHRGR